jgi:putative acetyltransferase
MRQIIEVRVEPWDCADGVRLRDAQRRELDGRYDVANHEPGTPPSAEDIAVFVLARDDAGNALGCGALRLLGPGSAEIKRMYVEPAARGRRIAVAILRALEEQARQLGVTRLLLETGTAQPEAMRLYTREGYTRIENFGPYVGHPLSVCYARDLD